MSILVAFAAWAAAALVSTIAPSRWRWGANAIAWLFDAVGAVLAVIAGGRVLDDHPMTASTGVLSDLGSGLGTTTLQLDRISGLFAVIAFAVAVPACLAGVRSTRDDLRRLPALIAGCLASVLLVLCADHLFVLLFGWEALTLAFFLLAGLDRTRSEAPSASVAAATFGKASGAFLLVGGLIAARSGGGFTFAALHHAHGAAASAAFALMLAGFAIKVGIVPVQIWLPPTYATAPPAARAIMAGAAVNVGFYGMWRVLQLFGPAPVWLAAVVLVLAGITAVLGIAHAAVHPDARGLVAWSSVENAGVITTGYGVALIGSHVGDQRLMALGLLAATAQVIAHALGKTTLFVAVGELDAAYGTTNLDRLRGVARERPWSGLALVVGAVTLGGLPLTAGFASEWLTLESLMQQFRIDHLDLQLASAVAGALLALTVGIASVTFVRLIALTGFGGRSGVRQREPLGLRAAAALLTVGCLGVAAAAPWEVDVIGRGLSPLVGTTTSQAHQSPWVIQPIYGAFSSLSPSWLWVVIPAYGLIILVVASALSRGQLWKVRRVPAWSSASPGVERGVGYTSFGYANPMRKVLANLLLTHHQLDTVRSAERAVAEQLASSSQPVPAKKSPANGVVFTYEVDVVEVVAQYLYRPLYRALQGAAKLATRLQSGRLDAYMAYMLLVLLGVIALVAGIS